MIIDVFTYSNASPEAAFSVEELIDAAKKAGLDGICVTDKNISSHAKNLLAAGKNAGFFVGVGVEIETSAGRVTAFPKSLDADFVAESWKNLGENPAPESVLDFFHSRGGIVVARDVFCHGNGLKDRVHSVKDSRGKGFDVVDTIAAYRRRIDNELSIEAQNVLGVSACAGSGVSNEIQAIGSCATLFVKKIRSQGDFVDAMKGDKHWACTLRDVGDACPMGTPPRSEDDRAHDDRRRDDRGPRDGRRRDDRRRDDRRRDDHRREGRDRNRENDARPQKPRRPRKPRA